MLSNLLIHIRRQIHYCAAMRHLKKEKRKIYVYLVNVIKEMKCVFNNGEVHFSAQT